jgi:hypothetical protein
MLKFTEFIKLMIPYGKQTIEQKYINSVLKVLNENEFLTTC